MITPKLSEPWPETAEQWQLYATISQWQSDQRRQMTRAIRREHRREMVAMLRAGGTTIGLLLTLAVAYLMVWWMWALVTP
jgi:hypothetical protein